MQVSEWDRVGTESGRSGDGAGTEWGRSGDGVGTEPGRSPAEEPDGEIERPSYGLGRPRGDGIGQVEHARAAFRRRQDAGVLEHRSVIGGQHAAQACEQGGLARAVGTDHPEYLSRPDRERHVGERGEVPVALCQP